MTASWLTVGPALAPSTGQELHTAIVRTARAIFDSVACSLAVLTPDTWSASHRKLIRSGRGERELSDDIRDLAHQMYGVDRFWHKRVVRAGANTLEPYRANPPDRRLTDHDIVFLDFGPIFGEWEADVGRTVVLGDDPAKHRLGRALPRIWHCAKEFFDASPEVTGAQLFDHVLGLIEGDGWSHGTHHAGHQVGEFPHDRVNGDQVACYITGGSDQPMCRRDPLGRQCHWILEVHLIDPTGTFGGFMEQLLDI